MALIDAWLRGAQRGGAGGWGLEDINGYCAKLVIRDAQRFDG